MNTFKGIALAPGYGDGRASLYRRTPSGSIPRYRLQQEQVDPELARFEKALDRSVEDLEALKNKVVREISEREAGIFDAHLALLQDPSFIEKCRERVRRDLINVEQALTAEVRDMERLLGEVENEYIRERRQDVRDMGARVLDHLSGNRNDQLTKLPKSTVIVTRELLPSDTVSLDQEHVAGIVTECGGATSHATILARALGIPYVGDVHDATKIISTGDRVLVDGEAGTVEFRPNRTSIHRFNRKQEQYERVSLDAEKGETRSCKTSDGVTIELLANIGQIRDAHLVHGHRLSGVGLFRTECLFLDTKTRPDLRKHNRAYTTVLDAVDPDPVVIRTLDFGGDKVPDFLRGEKNEPSALGLRGLRYSIEEAHLFQTQLRAILRASTKGAVRCLFPMVIGHGDVQAGLNMLQQIAVEEGIPELPPVGAMIETPAAVFEIDTILNLADFISVGTNDLTQYILAADRDSVEMIGEYSILHPAVLKALKHIQERADKSGKQVTVCGEAAGDPATACLLIGMGYRKLSMSPLRAARVRRMIRALDLESLTKTARQALACRTGVQVQEILVDATRDAARKTGLESAHYEFTE